MKNTVLVLFVLSGLGLHAQVWIDSLRSAQEQYKQNDFERALDLYKKAEVDLKDVLFLKLYNEFINQVFTEYKRVLK